MAPFANLSEGFFVLFDFLARVRAFRQISRWEMSPNWELAFNRHAITQQFGSLAALLWAKHISGRFRCAVSKDTSRLTGTDKDFLRVLFPTAAVAVSVVGSCRAHEPLAGFCFWPWRFPIRISFAHEGPRN